jgi:hypothetical protein
VTRQEPAAPAQRSVSFRCAGHPSVRASHLKSLEFTRAADITPRATCVLGVEADFDPALLRGFRGPLRVAIEAGGHADVIRALANPAFDSADRIVIRTTQHRSPETFATGADKGASRLDRALVAALAARSPARVTISDEPAPEVGEAAAGWAPLAAAAAAIAGAGRGGALALVGAGGEPGPEAIGLAGAARASLLWTLDAERLDAALAGIEAAAGDRAVALSLDLPAGRRLLRGNVSGVRAQLAGTAAPGVPALLVVPGEPGAGDGEDAPDPLDGLVLALLDAGVSSRTIATAVAALPGRSYRRSYERVLRLKSAREG